MPYDPDLILTDDTRQQAIDFLVDTQGYHRAALVVMSTVEIANLYHGHGTPPVPTDIQRLAASIIVTMAQHGYGAPAFDEELVRYLARQEAQQIIDTLPPRHIVIEGPKGTSVTLDGLIHYATTEVIQIVAFGHPVMMVGPAGCGKTTIGEHAALALGLPFYITNVVNDTHELMGFIDGHGKYHVTPFRNAFEHGGVWVADEIDAWDAAALLAANSALANGYANFPDRPERVQRHADFRMVATANTFGTGADRVYVGRNELDAASLDRFAVIEVDYDLNLEQAFAGDQTAWLDRVWKVRDIVQSNRIRHVVSSRAIGMGATALRGGIKWDRVENIYLFKGMSEKDRSKVDG